MKKAFFTTVILAAVFVSCKKDYTCSCSDQMRTLNSGTIVQDSIHKYDYKIKQTSHRTAYNHCNHTYWENTSGTITITDDKNCSLK